MCGREFDSCRLYFILFSLEYSVCHYNSLCHQPHFLQTSDSAEEAPDVTNELTDEPHASSEDTLSEPEEHGKEMEATGPEEVANEDEVSPTEVRRSVAYP